jgi:hypothetical protein
MVNGTSMLPAASFLSLIPHRDPRTERGGRRHRRAGALPAFAELLKGLSAKAGAVLAADGQPVEPAASEAQDPAATAAAQAASLAKAATA